jgi:hypothetical protein
MQSFGSGAWRSGRLTIAGSYSSQFPGTARWIPHFPINGKPGASRGRKATGPSRSAGLPNEGHPRLPPQRLTPPASRAALEAAPRVTDPTRTSTGAPESNRPWPPLDRGSRSPISAPYRAAWVPFDDPARPWDPTPPVARWLVEQAEQRHLKLTLVTDLPLEGLLPPALRYVREWERQTGTRPAAGRAVLAYLPTLATAARAFRIGYGGAVAVVEGAELPLTGWAAEVGALNLLTGAPEPALPSDTIRCLQRLLPLLHGGPLTPQQADAAITILCGTRTDLSAHHVAGYLLAHSCSPRTARRLLRSLSAAGPLC